MEKSPLLWIIGDTPEHTVIDFLIEGLGIDYTKIDIARGAEISRPTLYKILRKLENEEVIMPTRIIGRSQLYTLNRKNEKVRFLLKMEEMLLAKSFDDAGEKMVAKVPNRIAKR